VSAGPAEMVGASQQKEEAESDADVKPAAVADGQQQKGFGAQVLLAGVELPEDGELGSEQDGSVGSVPIDDSHVAGTAGAQDECVGLCKVPAAEGDVAGSTVSSSANVPGPKATPVQPRPVSTAVTTLHSNGVTTQALVPSKRKGKSEVEDEPLQSSSSSPDQAEMGVGKEAPEGDHEFAVALSRREEKAKPKGSSKAFSLTPTRRRKRGGQFTVGAKAKTAAAKRKQASENATDPDELQIITPVTPGEPKQLEHKVLSEDDEDEDLNNGEGEATGSGHESEEAEDKEEDDDEEAGDKEEDDAESTVQAMQDKINADRKKLKNMKQRLKTKQKGGGKGKTRK
jgi:hypothetical protein